MLEDWIDDLVAVAGSIDSHKGGKVRAFKVAGKADIPLSLTAGMFPCALTYVEGVEPMLSAGLSTAIWKGVTAFYLYPNLDMGNIPFVQRYYGKILQAWAGAATLGGKVDHNRFADGDAITFVKRTYGDGDVYFHTLEVRWEVKEKISSVISLGG
jgi:hypothetical protein